MADFDFSDTVTYPLAVPRQQKSTDVFLVMSEGSPDQPGAVLSLIQKFRTQAGTSYTIVLADSGMILVSSENSNPVFTLPLNASVAFELGTLIHVDYKGTGTMTINIGSGGIVDGVVNGVISLVSGQRVRLWKTNTDTWESNVFPANNYGTLSAMAGLTFY